MKYVEQFEYASPERNEDIENESVIVVIFRKDKRVMYNCRYQQEPNILWVIDKKLLDSKNDIDVHFRNQKIVSNNEQIVSFYENSTKVQDCEILHFNVEEIEQKDKLYELSKARMLVNKNLDEIKLSEADVEKYIFDNVISDTILLLRMGTFLNS